MAVNRTLRFSWGHIIAFIALIFISYTTFMGISYFCDGNFFLAGAGVVVVNLLLVAFFFTPQLLKASDAKFGRKIVFERIFFICAPFIFVIAMAPYSHFWTVFDKREEVESTFSQSIKAVPKIFDSYEAYAQERMEAYTKTLDSFKESNNKGGNSQGDNGSKSKYNSTKKGKKDNKKGSSSNSTKARSTKSISSTRYNNARNALNIQLFNYADLRNGALNWIKNAEETTVWNVFMMGNLDTIEEAIYNWTDNLNLISTPKMKDEKDSVKPFSSEDESVTFVTENFKSLRTIYSEPGLPTPIAIGIAVLLYGMLLLPYLLQKRHTKSLYRLFGKEANASTIDFSIEGTSKSGGVKSGKGKDNSHGNSNYDSFTL